MRNRFFLDFPIRPLQVIAPGSRFFLLGSCFTEHIGSRLLDSGFDTTYNPYGILYNPLSMERCIQNILQGKTYDAADLALNPENRFVSFDHHGVFSGTDAGTVCQRINESSNKAKASIEQADCVILTLGNAWVFRHLSMDRIVANCHKFPGNAFRKFLLDIDSITAACRSIIQAIREVNPGAVILLTVSPVKHLRDGVVENLQGKASLILALRKVMELNEPLVHYFPAYEIVSEELRDYRFYEQDHAHPNVQAIDYVWERFRQTCFTKEAQQMADEAYRLNRSMLHRPIHSEPDGRGLTGRMRDFLAKYRTGEQE